MHKGEGYSIVVIVCCYYNNFSPTCHKKSCVHKAQKILGMEQEIQELKEQLK